MKKKIAILTQPLGGNYGGLIQNYALQTLLKEMDFDPITINRTGKTYSSFREKLGIIKNETFNKLKGSYIYNYSSKEKEYINQHLIKFVSNNIDITKSITDTQSLRNEFDKQSFYAVIIGSDQTWRPKYSPNIYNYFLDFLNNDDQDLRRIAYASSFGTDEWEFTDEEHKVCKELIKNFDAVSVREDSAVNICKNKFDFDAVHVLDPTLLIDKKYYLSLFKNLEIESKSGIFNYQLDNNESKYKFVDHLSKKMNLKVFNINGGTTKIKNVIKPSVENWLKSFYDADFVVTDSFHGTIFSIIFNKPFYAIQNKERGSSRFLSLLQLFDLEDRLVTDVTSFNLENFNKEIDYEIVNKKLSLLRMESISFLKTNLLITSKS